MPANIFEYNGVQLRDCQTLSMREEPEYASDGITFIGMRYHLRVLGYFGGETSNYYPQIGTDPNDPNDTALTAFTRPGAGQHFAYLNQYLNTPRKRLRYFVDAIPFNDPTAELPAGGFPFAIHDVVPAGEIDTTLPDNAGLAKPTHEIAGGPKPVMVDVTHIAANEVWRVECEYTFVKPALCREFVNEEQTDLDPNSTEADGVQDQFATDRESPAEFTPQHRQLGIRSHIWSCTEQVDTNFFTTRTYRGELRVISPEINVMDYRVLCVPPLIPGMRRESIEYIQSTDRLTLAYTIVDKEVFVTPPKDFTTLTIEHTEGSVLPRFAASAYVLLVIKLGGDRAANLYNMLRYAWAIADAKTRLYDRANKVPDAFNFILDSCDVSYSEGTHQDNSVTLSITGRRVITKEQEAIPGNAKWISWLSPEWFQRLADDGLRRNVPGLDPYANDLMRGNRELDGGGSDVPDDSGGIGPVSAFHAALSEACATNFAWTNLADNTEADDTRRAAIRFQLLNGISLTPTISAGLTDQVPSLVNQSENSLSHNQYQYTASYITTSYDKHALSIALPSSETTSTSTLALPHTAFVRIGPEQWIRTVHVVAERYGATPEMPEAKDLYTDDGLLHPTHTSPSPMQCKLLSATVTPSAPQYTPDKSGRLFRIEGTYRYATSYPPARLRMGIPANHVATTIGRGDTDTDNATLRNSYNPLLTDVMKPSLGSTSTTQNCWQIDT